MSASLLANPISLYIDYDSDESDPLPAEEIPTDSLQTSDLEEGKYVSLDVTIDALAIFS